MAAKATFEVDADTDGAVRGIENIGRAAQEATADVKKLEAEQKKAAQEASREAEKSARALDSVGKRVINSLDQATGGLLGKIFDTAEAVRGVSTSFKGLKGAIAASGIGLLIVALGELVANWDKVSRAVTETFSATGRATKAQREYAEQQRRDYQIMSETATMEERLAAARGESAIKLKQLQIETMNLRIAELDAAISAEADGEKRVELMKERLKLVRDERVAREELKSIVAKTEEDETKKAADEQKKREADAKAAADKRWQQLWEANRRREALNDEERKRQEDMAKRQEELDKLAFARQDFSLTATEAYQDELTEIEDEAIWEREQKRIEEARRKKKEQDDQLAKEKAFREQINELAVSSALGTLSALSELNKIYDQNDKQAQRRAFNREKALNIAETIISTYSAAQKAYTSQLIPGDPTSLGRAAIAASVAVAGGLARVATIAATKFNEGAASAPSASAGATGGGASLPSQPPQFNIVGQGGVNQLAATIAGQSQRPVQAYVVGSQVQTQQELDRKRIRTASFG